MNLLKGYFQKSDLKDLLIKRLNQLEKINNIMILTDHAYKRWNQRVAYSQDKNILEKKLNILYSLLSRIEFISHEIGIIDREVLFTYEQKQEKIIITTFYGRLSQNPALHHFEAMRNYNQKVDDYIGLSLDRKTISTLSDPPIPSQRMIFKGSTSKYLIDKYDDKERSMFLLLVLEGPNQGEYREIYSDDPECEKIGKSVRQALILLGHKEFVYQHVVYHFPDELSKRIQKVKE